MADIQDYVTVYRRFFEEFATTVDPDDQLPVKVAGYYLCDSEIVGEIVDWTYQYLNQKCCPSSLMAPLTKIVIDEIKFACKKQPTACGYRSSENTYQPLRLMQVVTGKVNEVCLRYCDNGKLATLPPPSPGPPISSCAIKNTRRCMEDRHVIIEDFHTVFNVQDRSPASYYAVFDGHAGTDAAMYSVSHLHQFLAESSFYPTDPERALKDAFSRTDSLFLEKSNRENLKSGTTAVCALLRPKEKMLYVAWLGDSQAFLVRNGQAVKVVNPHKPDRQDERERIEDMGGCVLFWGTWRVNGQLAVSRAIGDMAYKPYVTADPDVTAVPLNGTEDFLVLACDGLWDFVTEQEALVAVYQQIYEAPGDVEAVSQRLVQLSKQQGSTDNITVIVVFLTHPAQLASRPIPLWENNGPPPQEARAMESNFDLNTNTTSAENNPFLMNPTSESVPFQKGGLLLDLGSGGDDGQVYKRNGTSPSVTDLYFLDRPANCKNSTSANYDDEDFGPETDVDAVDDVLLSPTSVKSAALNNNPFGGDEKGALEADLELQRQQLSDFDPVTEPREETPTPPADRVPGVASLVPESDNVGESGEDSEDEWNYYRVEPTAEGNQEATQPVCQKPAGPELKDEVNMESQLNPDAAEFVPSPTQTMPSIEEVLLAQSPSKAIPMEDITVPSQLEFQHEVSQRPSELDIANESPEVPENKPVLNLPDLISSEVDDVNPLIPSLHLENEGVFSNILEHEQQNDVFPDQQDSNVQGLILDESEVTSTKAEFGDDSVSFLTTGSELQKTVTESVSSLSPIEKSFTDSNFLESELVAKSSSYDNELFGFNEVEVYWSKCVGEETALHEDGSLVLETGAPLCFEVQKELVPEMELKPERVKLDSEGASSVEESGSPLQAEDKQLGKPEEPTIMSQVPYSPVNSPVSNLHPLVLDESTATSQIQETSLQDSLATDVPSPSAEYPIESETVPSKPLQSPFSTHQVSFWGSASPIMPSATPVLSEDLENRAQAIFAEFKAETDPHDISSPPLAVSEVQEKLNSDNLPRPTTDEIFAVNEERQEVEARVETEEELGKCQETEISSQLLDPFGIVTSQSNITDETDPLKQDVCTISSSVLEQQPIEDEVKETGVTQNLPPAPVHVPEVLPQLSDVEPPEAVAVESVQVLSDVEPPEAAAVESVQVSEKVGNAETEDTLVAAAAATAVATAVAAGAIVAHEKPAEKTNISEKNVEAKKPTPSKDKKEPTAVKAKLTKTPSSPKPATPTTGVVRALQKSKLTSPTKPPSPSFHSSTPKKSVTSAPPASRTTKLPAAPNKPKPGTTSPTKPLSCAAKSSAAPHARPGTTTTKSLILSNGDVAKAAVTKKTAAPTSARPQSRPSTAPATAKAGTIKQSGAVTSRTTLLSAVPPRTKPGAVDGAASKSRPAGTLAPTTARNKVGSTCDPKSVTNKKETANKQISSHTITNKSTTVTTTRSALSAATRRVTGVTKTAVTSSVSKVGPKKTTSARTITGTRAPTTASTKTTKTEVIATSLATENNEILKVQQVD